MKREEALRWYRASLSHFRAGGLHQYAPELLTKLAECRRAISGEPEVPLLEWLDAALVRSKVDSQLAQNVALRCGWNKQPLVLAEFCNYLEMKFGRELGLLNLAIEAKHQGIEYKAKKNFVATLICAAFGLDICVALDDAHGLSICANDMGFCYMKLGYHTEALNYLEKAVAIERSVNDYRELSIRLRNLAQAYEELGRLDDAESASREAEMAIRNVDDAEYLVEVLLAVADILKLRKKPEAFNKYDEAGVQAERLGNFKALVRVYGGKGKAKWDEGEFIDSNMWRARALELSMQEREFTNAALMANLIANSYHAKLKMPCEAEQYSRRAIQIATDAGNSSLAQQLRQHARERGYDLSGP
jgi:tetratricopeptide (TPR) repeat protein